MSRKKNFYVNFCLIHLSNTSLKCFTIHVVEESAFFSSLNFIKVKQMKNVFQNLYMHKMSVIGKMVFQTNWNITNIIAISCKKKYERLTKDYFFTFIYLRLILHNSIILLSVSSVMTSSLICTGGRGASGTNSGSSSSSDMLESDSLLTLTKSSM